MEYVEGITLRQLTRTVFKQKQRIPVPLAVYLMEQAALGLHYAHSIKDPLSGVELNIVHRDVSPHNIMLSYDGDVKLIDFGVVKASTNVNKTMTGVIKGKPSYMSPEQVLGEKLDGRSDLFSLAIVFWEILSGKKLFSPPNPKSSFSVLKLIEKCDKHVVSPSEFNSSVDPELSNIVLKALAQNRDKRYSTCLEFHQDLKKYMQKKYPDFNKKNAAQFVAKYFKEELESLKEFHTTLSEVLHIGITQKPGITRSARVSGNITGTKERSIPSQSLKSGETSFQSLESKLKNNNSKFKYKKTVSYLGFAALLGYLIMNPKLLLQIPGVSEKINQYAKKGTTNPAPKKIDPVEVTFNIWPQITSVSPSVFINNKEVQLKSGRLMVMPNQHQPLRVEMPGFEIYEQDLYVSIDSQVTYIESQWVYLVPEKNRVLVDPVWNGQNSMEIVRLADTQGRFLATPGSHLRARWIFTKNDYQKALVLPFGEYEVYYKDANGADRVKKFEIDRNQGPFNLKL